MVGYRTIEFVAWAYQPESAAERLADQFLRALPDIAMTPQDTLRDPPLPIPSRTGGWWQQGSDSFHFQTHTSAPMEIKTGHWLIIGDPQKRSAALFTPSYFGWYRKLHDLPLPSSPHHSWRVDVTVEPLGWLGTFRHSRRSRLWFSGQHRWHELGLPEQVK